MISEAEALDPARMIEQTHCPICAASGRGLLGTRHTIHPVSNTSVRIWRCESCEHWYTDPTPTQDYLLALYGEDSASVVGPGERQTQDLQFEQPAFHWILRAERHRPGSEYVELGPGDGSLMRSFLKRGWRCAAIEPSGWVQNFPGFYREIDDLPHGRKYDVLVAHDVLEHVADPVATLSRLTRMLNGGARVYLSFPNASSLRAEKQRTAWRMVRPIGHLHYFSRASVQIMLRQSGLIVERCRTIDFLRPPAQQLRDILGDITKPRQAWYRVADFSLSLKAAFEDRGDQWRVIARVDPVN